MIDPENIPSGWTTAKLGEVCSYTKGKMPKVLTKEKTKEFSVPYINIKAFEKGIFSEYTDGEKCNLCEDGDLLMVWDGARCGLIGKAKKGAVGSTLMKIIPSENIHEGLFFHFLKSKYHILNTNPKGVGIPHIEPTLLWNLDFPLPPYNEQKKIFAKLEQLLTDLDKGIEQLKTVQLQLKVYRQAVLKWAFEGRLNYDSSDLYDDDDSNNHSNQDNQKNHSADKGELPKGWKWKKTGEVIQTINNGYTPKKEFLTENGGEIPFLKVYNLNFDGTLNYDKNPTFIPKSIHQKELKRSVCYPGDVLINIVGPPLGKVSIVSKKYPEWNINQAIVLFRPNKNILSKFLSYFLQNPKTIQWLESTSKATAGQWNVKVSTCREIPIPVCSVQEQHLIIQEIESRLSVCDKIEETIENSLQQAEALRLSIIKKAFEGKLVPQDPNDEPAEKLLERIRKMSGSGGKGLKDTQDDTRKRKAGKLK